MIYVNNSSQIQLHNKNKYQLWTNFIYLNLQSYMNSKLFDQGFLSPFPFPRAFFAELAECRVKKVGN